MTQEERFSLILVFSIIVVVYVYAFGGLVRLSLEKFNLVKTKPSVSQVWFRRFIFIIALFGFGCFGYAYFIEPYRLSVRNIEIKSAKIPKGGKPIRIVHISDVHSDAKARLEEKLPAAIAEQQPDLIIFSGDSLNSPEGLPIFRKCLTEISKIAPTYVVRGNWDVWYWKEQNLFGETGAKQLNGVPERIEINGIPIWLAGVFVGDETKLSATLNPIPKDEFSIFVFHYPDLIEEVSRAEIDLYCAGHTHGGQVAMPFYGALVTFSKFGKKYEGGTYQVNKTWLNVNRGIGMEGGDVPRVRFWARPEITVIDIISE